MRAVVRRIVPRRWRRSDRLARLVLGRCGGRVLCGPFAGMVYGDRAFGSQYYPKLLGTYEKELAVAVEEILSAQPSRIVVAGAAEGYYAVGLALRAPGARVIAFEAVEEARRAISETAARNGVADRVEVLGLCDLPALEAALGSDRNAFLLCDVEGAEAVLLDPRLLPRLREIAVLVETHDFAVPGVEAELCRRFETSHRVERLVPRSRTVDDAVSLDVPPSWRGALEQLLSERRPAENGWLWMRPRAFEVPGSPRSGPEERCGSAS